LASYIGRIFLPGLTTIFTKDILAATMFHSPGHSREIQIVNMIGILICFSAILLVGCGGKKEDNRSSQKPKDWQNLSHIYEKLGPYQGWIKKRFENVVFIYPPDHPQAGELETYAKVFAAMERQAAAFLHVDIPDSLTIYFYNGPKHGITVTGFVAPFADGEVIHFWLPSTFGQPVTKRLLPLWSSKVTKFKFLKEGIITLMDGTGENYHVRTQNFSDSGQLIALNKLAEDTTVDADRDRYRSAMAASFVDYVAYAYGILFLKDLYESDDTFDKSVADIFMLPVDSLEKDWLKVVEQVARSQPDSAN
jgi:hypothetical protein